MPIDNVVEGETILTAWGNDVADTINALELAPPAHALADHTGTLATAQLADNAVTYAKLQNVSATDRLLGRDAAGAGDAQELTIYDVQAWARGTSFPGSPTTGDRFFRTDLGIEFYWDGTRWLSTTLYYWAFRPQGGALSGGSTSRSGSPKELGTGLGIWCVRGTLLFLVESGGTALGASHNWTAHFGYEALGGATNTPLASWTINSGASGDVRESTPVAIGSKLPDGAMMRSNYVKTGTPGNLWPAPVLEYRLSGS